MSKSQSGQPADEHLAVPPLLQRMKFDNVRERPAPPATAYQPKSLVTSRGETIQSTAINRTATFAFYLADDYFGVISVYVPASAAEGFSFTSALPLQVLNGMADILQPYVNTAGCD